MQRTGYSLVAEHSPSTHKALGFIHQNNNEELWCEEQWGQGRVEVAMERAMGQDALGTDIEALTCWLQAW